ncbi:MAG: hypothetical protein HY735_06230 [Verrucomicrobia bacterium]|nr:hypothetical protein [Verrucomicrobiota bacterium]
MKTLLRAVFVALLLIYQGQTAEPTPGSASCLKNHGLRNGTPAEVLPQNAIVHLQINQPQRILENLERFVVATVPDKLLPEPLQGLLASEHPLLTVLGMHTVQAPLTADQLAEKTGLATDQPASLTLYPGLPPRSIILSLPVKNHATFEGLLRGALRPKKVEASSLADKQFVRFELDHPQLRELYVACSADRVFLTGEQSLLLLLYPDNSLPRLKDNPRFAGVFEQTSREDVWFTFDPALVKPILPQIQFFEYLPLQFVSQHRAQLLGKIPAQQRQLIEQRLRLQMGVQSLEQLADYAECVLTATYEELFEFVLTGLKSFNGVTLAVKLDAKFPQATAYLHSDQYRKDSGTQAIPMEAVRTALSRLPTDPHHLSVVGRKPKVEPSARIASWLKRIHAGFEAKHLNLALVEALEKVHRETIRPQPIEAQVPWTLTARTAVNPPPAISDAESLREYFGGLASLLSYPATRTVTVVPSQTENLLERSLAAEREALIHNRELADKTFSHAFAHDRAMQGFIETVYRLKHQDLNNGVKELTWETAWVTRGGFFGFNQHELVNRRVYFTRKLGDYTLFHQASRDAQWLSGLQLQANPRISPGLSKLLDRVPEGADFFCLHRPLADLPPAFQWVQGLEELVHRDVNGYLAKVRQAAEGISDPAVLARKIENVKFSPAALSINRDTDTGELYCLLPGNLAFPRPKIAPAVLKLFAEFNESADQSGGVVVYTRVSDGKFEGAILQNTDAISKLIRTVGNAIQEQYLGSPEKMAGLKQLIVTERDRDSKRFNQILARNPDWEFLPRPGARVQVTRARKQTEAKPQQPIAPRDPDASAKLIDLSPYYNASPNDSWHSGGTPNNDLKSLPQGIHEFAGTKFDVRGIVQLSGKDAEQQLSVRFPKEVKDIKIGQSCGQIHFLQATGWQARDGTKVGAFIVHYQDGQAEEVPIVYGTHVRDWWTQPGTPTVTASEVAWKGANAASSGSGVSLQLYKTTWKNPRPDAQIASLDYVSAMSSSAPFLIAVAVD